MPSYISPGVYVEEVSQISRPVEGVNTSITAFVGLVHQGPIGEPILVDSFSEYVTRFSEIIDENDSMGLAVQLFFLNGGLSAYICAISNDESNSNDGNPIPSVSDYILFYDQKLKTVPDISIIVVPGISWDGGTGQSILSATLAHCQSMQNRVLIIEPPVGVKFENAADVNRLGLPTSSLCMLYYPWVSIANPFFIANVVPSKNKTMLVAPSAFVAGIWSKTDTEQGVWKSPAGVNTQLFNAIGLEFSVKSNEQSQLNQLGVNCIRQLPNLGIVLWGARTLASQIDPQWRYISVRRMAIFIEQSVYKSIQWAVFEPNDQQLWQMLRTSISVFMNDLFRAGAFQGTKHSDAYFVSCGLGSSMTQNDIDRGLVVVTLGFAAIKPAEFVSVRIQLKVGTF